MDLISPDRGKNLGLDNTFHAAPGGAPANTVVGLRRLGIRSAFIGGIGADHFGNHLRALLLQEEVDVTGAVVIPGTNTRMAYVTTKADGDRELAEFTQVGCADALFGPQHLLPDLFADAHVLHLGSISQINPVSRQATDAALDLAYKAGMIISYDPNVRLGLWPSPGENNCRDTILATLRRAHIVKINEGELKFLAQDKKSATQPLSVKLRNAYNIPLLVVTLDARGVLLIPESTGPLKVPGRKVQLVEATGAGDAWNAGFLHGLVNHHFEAPSNQALDRLQVLKNLTGQVLKNLTGPELTELGKFANAVGALACTRRGAIPAMPTMAEVQAFLA